MNLNGFANAGIHRCNTLLIIKDDNFDLMIQTNIYGTVKTLREAVPLIIEGGGGTVVINCSDQWFVGKPMSRWRTGGTLNISEKLIKSA